MEEVNSYSIVVPVFNVEQYIHDFLNSLESQTYPLEKLDIVFVDDGSPDACGDILDAWVSSHRECARVIHKENGGLCSARNVGLEYVANKWVTFCDPDDMLPPCYFESVDRFMLNFGAEDPCLLVTRIMRLDDSTGTVRDRHPLRKRFKGGDKLVDLDRFPDFIHLQAASGFYKVSEIRKLNLYFEPKVRPVFEDAHFTLRYLANQPRHLVGAIASAEYWYRMRQSADSLVNVSWSKNERYTDLPREGYLDSLVYVKQRLGYVPLWAQNTILYDLMFYYTNDARMQSPVKSLDPETSATFHAVVSEVMQYIDSNTIRDYSIRNVSWSIKHALIASYKGEECRPDFVRIFKVDRTQRLVGLSYRFSGEAPKETFFIRGIPTAPVYAKTRAIVFLGRALEYERVVWLPLKGTLRVLLDGTSMPLACREPEYDAHTWRSIALERLSARVCAGSAASILCNTLHYFRSRTARRALLVIVWAKMPWVRARYAGSWVLMDRDSRAGDNAEHLYRYIATSHPETKLFFVLRRRSPDWRRLKHQGFRLIPFGTIRWRLLLLNARHVVSSQVDHYVVQPLNPRWYGSHQWRYTFLQHGVIENDVSRWLNGKMVDLLVTSTAPEYKAIIGNNTPYKFSTHEVRFTGLARWDELLRKANTRDHKDLIVFMPTWRRSLLGEQVEGGNDRFPVEGFWESEYAKTWSCLLSSDELMRIAESHDLHLAFMPHPNMKPYLSEFKQRYRHAEVFDYETSDVQEILARAAVVVTDYSSIAFDAAYIDCPVVYFQFDRDKFFGGEHLFRPGYFDYERDGFGPVCTDVSSASDEIKMIVEGSQNNAEEYQARRQRTFTLRDGQACARTYQAICDLCRDYSHRIGWPGEEVS